MMTAAGIPTEAYEDIAPLLWTKLFYNAALNPLGALLRLNYGALAADPDLRAIMDEVIEEAFAVATALDVPLPYESAEAYRAVFYSKLVPATFNHRPTMLYDLEQRGRTDIMEMNGKVVELAGRVGLRADTNRLLTHLIRARERMWHKRVPDRRKLDVSKNQSLEHGSNHRAGRARVSLRMLRLHHRGRLHRRCTADHQHPERAACEGSRAFPRDARTAFLMDPKEHLAVMREIDDRKLALKIVYHSHPDHEAYFSPTDRRQACSFDPDYPDYPETAYVVMSIMGGKFNRAAAFVWDSEKKEFVETKLTIE